MYSHSNTIHLFNMLQKTITELLSTFKHPTLKYDLNTLNALQHVSLLDRKLYVEIKMPFAWVHGFEMLKKQISDNLLRITKVQSIDWRLIHNIATLKRVKNQPGINGVKNIIAISSGKGGVGKSSTAVNLALALIDGDVRVGILDADIYGPSIPTMLGADKKRINSPDGKYMSPIMLYNLATNSIGYLVSKDNAIIWRGPMASKILIQLLNETLWPELDYLLLDMPPGTGDIQLTLAKHIPVTGAIIVTTPQDIALIDARKGIIMFEKVGVPVLGVVENMSSYICRKCGFYEEPFGSGGAKQLSEKHRVRLLGKLPLNTVLREDLDLGKPTVIRRPESALTAIYFELASMVASQLYWMGEVIPEKISFRTV